MNFFRWLGLTGIVTLLIVVSTAFAASKLDDTDWRVEITPEGATIPHHVDLIHFKEGNFLSVIFQRKGFSSSPYTHKSKSGMWEAKQTNEAAGELSWEGEIKGEALTGTLTWKKPDGSSVKHALVGGPAPPPEEEEAASPDAEKKTTVAGKTTAATKKTTAAAAKKVKSWTSCALNY